MILEEGGTGGAGGRGGGGGGADLCIVWRLCMVCYSYVWCVRLCSSDGGMLHVSKTPLALITAIQQANA